ncbi:capsular exopolysaccharide family [Planococcus glaciei]|uniref:CpsD/CapB family tyrosine-protein kinase n=1 Tax=Planococcus glaciei TaxID=459472 RepID=UPI00088BA89C|nr:CpsD/CapB family tyrosine-protein kinase [Planococcus glaciei]SDI33798.1 capsular exopolysaccharide family [Planococcus glaciei]
MVKKKHKINKDKEQLVVIAGSQTHIAEQFRRLRSNINFSSSDQKIQSIVITSAAPSEGKTWVAANLAAIYAQEGKKVLLVDSDMRKPSAHEIFNTLNDVGLSNVLTGEIEAAAAIKKTFMDKLDLLACGPIPTNPAELLSSAGMDNFMESMKMSYDIIIADSPPLTTVVDGQILASKSDGSILVIHAGKTDRQEAIKAKDAITFSNGRLMGVILNNFLTPMSGNFQKR